MYHLNKQRLYTKKELDRIIELRMRKIHPVFIAAEMNRTKEAIDKVLSLQKKLRNIEYPKFTRKPLWNDHKVEHMASLYPKMTYSAIAAEYNISKSMMSALMKRRAEKLAQGTWMV